MSQPTIEEIRFRLLMIGKIPYSDNLGKLRNSIGTEDYATLNEALTELGELRIKIISLDEIKILTDAVRVGHTQRDLEEKNYSLRTKLEKAIKAINTFTPYLTHYDEEDYAISVKCKHLRELTRIIKQIEEE